MAHRVSFLLRLLLLVTLGVIAAPPGARAQADQAIYTDSLQNGWQNYGWATLNYANTAPVHSGADSISVSAGAYQALYLYHADFSSTGYTGLTFWVNGGPSGGQALQVQALLGNTAQTAYPLPALVPNVWQQVTVPLSALGAAGQGNLDGFWIKNVTGGTIPTFYVDDITLIHAPLPTSAHLTVSAAQGVRTMDGRVYGLNTAVWDYHLGDAASLPLLQQMQTQILRYPGGSSADGFDWSTASSGGTFPVFATLAQAQGAQGCITVNYGSGTPEMATAWVAYANGAPTNTAPIGVDAFGRDWHTAGYWAALRAAAPLAKDDGQNFLRIRHTAPFGIRYWEVGNECYGTWEEDQHGVAQGSVTPLTGAQWDPYTYAEYAARFIGEMKAVDPTIRVGVVGITGEDTDGNGQHAVSNPSEGGRTHTGWTPVALATLRTLGVTPDFLIDHRYPGAPGSENDFNLLTDSGTGWPSDAANLRGMLTDYVGAAGAGVELLATENNSVYGNPGKQSVSLVNGLYLADSVGSLAQTEINGLLWWDFRNGSLADDNNSASLYGWRLFGDYGVVATGDRADTPLGTPYPPFYAAKLLTHWARGGDHIVSAASDDSRLAVYAAQLAGGALALLVINKDAANDLTGHVAVSGFTPAPTAAVYSYGKPQDLANADLAQTTLTNGGPTFDYLFPSYSMTVIGLVPAPSPPTVAVAAAATPSPVTGTTTALSVLGADAQGESGLTYTWAATGPAPVTISPNATNAAKAATATFAAAGTYTLTVTIKDAAGLTATSGVSVIVQQTPTTVAVTPGKVSVVSGATQQFSAAVADQFGAAVGSAPAWTATGGTISAAGLYTAGPTPGTSYAVTASSGGVSGAAAVTVTGGAPAAPVNAATFVSQSVPTAMTAGQSYPVSVTMENTGTTTWTSAGSYHLGSQSPQDNTTWTAGNRVLLPNSVAPGQTVTFAFTATAPAVSGTVPFQWGMVEDGVQWFQSYTPVTQVAVTGGASTAVGNGATFVAQTVPSTMAAGQSYPVTVTMRNTGSTTWTDAAAYHLGSQSPQDNTLWTGGNRVPLPNSVAPGQSATFSFSVTAPDVAGSVAFQWGMVEDGVQWFQAYAPAVQVAVTGGASTAVGDGATFVSQSVPASMTVGQSYPVSVTMRNTGTTTWAPGVYKLGAQSPQDNTLWTGSNRVQLTAPVAPGQSVTFAFTVAAPASPGSYPFQWRMVEEFVAWFGDYTPAVTVPVGRP